ncbi:MAG: pyruvate, phosphate dikinase [Deltaproteobacteria bacterium]|nr:pyruvate, phosphate dikinase [Deltaproteobacteria bacterium]
MTVESTIFSTGLAGLDRVLKGILSGDNLTFHVDRVDEYAAFVEPFCRESLQRGRHVVYFRFGSHPALLLADTSAEVVALSPEIGFERFTYLIHQKIDEVGPGACYIFDCLSSLAASWFSDLMVGNFFALICPYLHENDTIAYFAFIRDEHSFHATTPIVEHAQILIDVFQRENRFFIIPKKVKHRHSTAMYMLHERRGDDFTPVVHSSTVTTTMRDVSWSWQDAASYQRGFWSKTFLQVEELLKAVEAGRATREEVNAFKPLLLKMMISRNPRVIELADKYFEIEDLLRIRGRMLATGRLGGKSVGMLLARAILKKDFSRYADAVEEHDSFFVGTDLFCTYLVSDGSWWMQQRRQSEEAMLQGAEDARRRIRSAQFPEHILKRFFDMLNHFGQAPIIVRSSSLLEDNFGNAFAGKYDSVFLPNQGNPEQRMEAFVSAVKKVFASTLSREALLYRKKRGLLERDEEMGLLVQRVSGCMDGSFFYPHMAGVGLSFNPYIWHESINPEAGMVRLVFGLGTRAVDRSDDDYTRLVALNAPLRRAELVTGDLNRFAQRKVDVLDLDGNSLGYCDFETVVKHSQNLKIHWFASRDAAVEEFARHRGHQNVFSWVLDFDRLLEETSLVSDLNAVLATLQNAYDYPVEVEFTVNFFSREEYRINLVQCRPLQIHRGGQVSIPPAAPDNQIVVRCLGPVIGRSRNVSLSRLIYVVPSEYSQLKTAQRFQVAEWIGKLTHMPDTEQEGFHQMLIGPGRWGTTTPSLGVPVSFAQINTVEVLCEIVAMSSSLVPDVSLGTHFFNELVEADMLYMAVFPGRAGAIWNQTFLDSAPNQLLRYAPEATAFSQVIRVIEPSEDGKCCHLSFYANALNQEARLFI